MFRIVSRLLALVSAAGFSAGLLLTSVVIVESWADLDPNAAIEWFATFGLPLGIVMLPFGVAATLFSVVGLLTSAGHGVLTLEKKFWLAAIALSASTLLLLPFYFLEANTLFFDATIALSDVPDEIQRWKFWNWVRTFLSALASIAILLALANAEHASGSRAKA